jgi:hypothetical protein
LTHFEETKVLDCIKTGGAKMRKEESLEEWIELNRPKTLAWIVSKCYEKAHTSEDEDIKAFYLRLFEVFDNYLLNVGLWRQKTMSQTILKIAGEFKLNKIYLEADEFAMIGGEGKTIDEVVIDWKAKR